MAIPPDLALPPAVARLARDLHAFPGRGIDVSSEVYEGRGTGRAAVAAVFAPGPSLLFIRRSAHQGDPWSGHMAFPGGREEHDDGGPRQAAERETREELGLDLGTRALCLGVLDDIGTRPRLPRKPIAVRPLVYWVDRRPTVQPNHEVDAVFWFEFERILAGEGRGSFVREYGGSRYTLPRMDLEGQRVWGLTLRMVDELLARLRRARRSA